MPHLFLAADHAGFPLKQELLKALGSSWGPHTLQDWIVQDLGPTTADSVDYPDFAQKLAQALGERSFQSPQDPQDKGVLICGSGMGISIAANRFSHVRAALVTSSEHARLARAHNDANVLCLGARFCTPEEALHWLEIFLTTPFEGGRHQQRVEKLGERQP